MSKKDRQKHTALSPLLIKHPWKTLLCHVPHLPPHQMIFQALFHLREGTHSTLGCDCLSNARSRRGCSSQCGVPIVAQTPEGTDLWQAGNWHRASSFQPLCQFSLSSVYQNWLELLTKIPRGRTDVANSHGCLHSISWNRQSQQNQRVLISRRTHLVLDSQWRRVDGIQKTTYPRTEMQMSRAQMPLVDCCTTGFWNQFSQSC